MHKILHIFPKGTFTAPFVSFINEYFDEKEHLFLVYGNNPNCKDLSIYKNVVYLDTSSKIKAIKQLSKLSRVSEKIIFHSLFNYKWASFVVFASKFSLRNKPKLFWRIWGGDLYNDFMRPKKSINNKIETSIRFFLKKLVIKNLFGITTPVKGDYNLAVKIFNAKAIYFKTVYNEILYSRNFLEEIIEKATKTNAKSVLLGNSATFTNYHFEAIDMLHEQRKKGEFEVICPLSYGNKKYAEKVIEYGKERLGNDFKPILKFMDKEKYIELLAGVDVALMNHKRQQALGNIGLLLRLGKKVYLRPEITSFSFYESLGAKVFDINKIRGISYCEFFYLSEKDRENNKKKLDAFFTTENAVLMWKRVFYL